MTARPSAKAQASINGYRRHDATASLHATRGGFRQNPNRRYDPPQLYYKRLMTKLYRSPTGCLLEKDQKFFQLPFAWDELINSDNLSALLDSAPRWAKTAS